MKHIKKLVSKIIDVKNHHLALIVFVAVFGLCGTIIALTTLAATSRISFNASNGTRGGCATSAVDATASGGSSTTFGACIDLNSLPTTLDATGATIQTTNYAIPGGAIYLATNGSDANSGSQSQPVATLNRAISLTASGGTIVVRAGTYRDWYTNGTATYATISKNITLQPYPGEQVWFDGSDVVTNWTATGGGQWYVDWNTPSFCSNGYYNFAYDSQPLANTGPCAHYDMYGDPSNPAAGDPQMVFKNNVYMPEVTTLGAATGDKFYYDQTNFEVRYAFGRDPNMNFNNLPDSLEIIVWNNFIKNYEDIAKFPENLKEIYVDMYQDEIEKKFKSYSHSLNHSFNITNKYY
jgi:hypothetical protein